MRKLSAKEKIEQSALKLFNEVDTLSITTNHIAKEAGISPGNLYYHYKNKEAIIIALYVQMSETYESNKSFESIFIASNPITQLHENFETLGKLFFHYRFLLRDINVLIALYPKLKEMFVKNQSKRIKMIQTILIYFVKEEILQEDIMKNIEKRSKLHWFITTYWQSFASTNGKVTQESIQEAKEVFFEFMIYPFLTQKGQKLLDEF